MAVDFLGALGAGSDIDSKSLVESLVAAERQPREASLNAKIDAAGVEISAYAEVASALGTLTSIFERLNDASEFQSATLSVAGNKTSEGGDAFTATLGSGASSGTSSSIRVTALAQTERWISSGVDASDTELNNGNAFTVSLSGAPETFLSSAIDPSTDQISKTAHGFQTGDVLYYEDNGSAIGGLTTKTNYYVVRIDDDTFKLAASGSDAEAGTVIDLTTAGNDSQTFKTNHEISLDAGATITDVVAAINAGSDLATATLVDRGSGAGSERYVISVEGSTGAENVFSVSTTASAGVYANFTNSQDASDAQVTVNGVSILRPSNVIDDVIDGITLNLFGVSASDGRVAVGRTTEVVENNIRDLVAAYNTMKSSFDQLADPDSTGDFGGVFAGNTSFRLIQDTVQSIFLNPSSTATDNLTYFSDIGISFTRTGLLEINDQRLSAALNNNFDELVTLFSADTDNQTKFGQADRGIAGDAIITLDEILARDGIILTQSAGLETRVADYQEKLEDLDRRMRQVQERYLAQFTAMETAIDQLNSTKDYLKTALEGLPFNNKNK